MFLLKQSILLFLASICCLFSVTTNASPVVDKYPRRTIAGVSVVDTPIVRSAQQYARQHGADFVYKHIMRSWLFGALILSHNSTLSQNVDAEVHAVAAILHDLGWDTAHSDGIVSSDRRFEVDGAIASRDFIRRHQHGKGWDERRVQLVWDAIALHTERKIAYFKEDEVQVVSKGIGMDFSGPGQYGVTQAEFEKVTEEFPRGDLKKGVNETIVWLCRTKASSTYDTWMQPFGEQFVANYSAVGNRAIDTIFSNL
ncbi:hypothetical protein B0H66DRAFT_631688 [Apodospora peruviana]|uniref:HD domain-containing protein n=1 Tax=Apodospora peruviana TaxID=516989 RepID=A0AAE0HUJ0_9PEZI|nr:hypothetical protein B0H66DRAFT_631688 [Apodospora peruviana]